MSPIQQMLLGAGGAVATKTYVDDIFSTFLYKGNNTNNHHIQNGVDLTEGGLVWIKDRDQTSNHTLTDSAYLMNTTNKDFLQTNTNNVAQTGPLINSFESNGFKLSSEWYANSAYDYSSWTFRKAPGFFDVVSWTGGDETYKNISHSLGSVPGMIIVKRVSSGTGDWFVFHRDLNGGTNSWQYRVSLNNTWSESSAGQSFLYSAPTATQFQIGDWFTGNGSDYIAYVFANGCGNSVKFDGTDDHLLTSSSSDFTFGTGDFTIEHWFKTDSTHDGVLVDARMASASYQTNFSTYITSNTYRFYSQGLDRITSSTFDLNTWHHVAAVRNSGTTTIYLNGVSQGTYSDSNNYDNTRFTIGSFGVNTSSYEFNGHISNVKITKGQALYTSNFTPSADSLTQASQGSTASNVKLLCCNSNSIIGTTVGSVTSGGNPTLTNDDPFGDSAANVFGENEDQSVIKTGSYVGTGSAGFEVNVGFEPSWVMVKSATSSENWEMYDSMRGLAVSGDAERLKANTTDSEDTNSNWFAVTANGFIVNSTSGSANSNGQTYIYLAIRRPDGYVGKPIELGTNAFNMPLGLTDGTKPAFNTGFPVDFLTFKKPAASGDWFTGARMMGAFQLFTNSSDDKDSNANILWDFQDGMGGWSGLTSGYQGYGFKRHAGFDVVCYTGNGRTQAEGGQTIKHSLSKTPEMIWLKYKNDSYDWQVYHKGLNGGTNPENYKLQLNDTSSESGNAAWWNNTAPTSTAFTVGDSTRVNYNGGKYIAMLFASVEGISSVGSYDGSLSDVTITTGFQPRFILIKGYNALSNGRQWIVMDSVRGFNPSGNTDYLYLNSSSAQNGGGPEPYISGISSTGFTLLAGKGDTNARFEDGTYRQYIYYAHA